MNTGMNENERSIATHGVPLSYHGGDPRRDQPEPMTDEEWCADMGIAPPPDEPDEPDDQPDPTRNET
jgi:hypothetical protein